MGNEELQESHRRAKARTDEMEANEAPESKVRAGHHLKITGYLDLKWDEYNHSFDPLP
jgi:hypothetical protein